MSDEAIGDELTGGADRVVATKGFEGLQVWQKARQLMLVVHRQYVPTNEERD